MIKYIGSKRKLLPLIVRTVRTFPEVRTVADLFSGTARVGHALKRAGYRVLVNDYNAYAHALATCYVQADREDVIKEAEALVEELNRLPGRPGYFTETFCERSRFFRPKNGERVDAVREAIARQGLRPELEAVLLTSLMEAADRVDSTVGVQMAYLKDWAPRAHNDLELRVPEVLPQAEHGKGDARREDALEAAPRMPADLAYLDPPYNQHSYLSNYHIWESLVRWDRPEVYGVACKRTECRRRKSPFNSRRKCHDAFARLIDRVRAPVLIVSFSNEGFISRREMEEMLSARGRVRVIQREQRRYVGAQIGVYNPDGEKVGETDHLHNKEYLYVVTPNDPPENP